MLEYFKSIGWPHISLVAIVFFLILFKRDLGELIRRISSINKDGIRTDQFPEAQREKKKNDAAQELLDAIGQSIVIQEIEARITNEMNSRSLDTNTDSTKVLIRILAASQLLLEFEQIHSLIFGSQIFLLKKLNEVSGQGKPLLFISEYFENVKQHFPNELEFWDLEQYLSFLKSRLLITISDDNYHITNLGVEYITWMVRNGRPENKPL